MLAGVGNEAFSRVNSRDRRRLRAPQDRFCERARAAADVEPTATRRHSQPVKELSGDQATPSAHIWLVCPGICPGITLVHCALRAPLDEDFDASPEAVEQIGAAPGYAPPSFYRI